MLDQKDRHIELIPYETDGTHQLLGLTRVHTSGRLIQQKELRLGCERAGDLELTLLTIREVGGLVVHEVLKVEYLENLQCLRIHLLLKLTVLRCSQNTV